MVFGKKSLWQRLKELALTDVGVLARGGVDADALDRLEQGTYWTCEVTGGEISDATLAADPVARRA